MANGYFAGFQYCEFTSASVAAPTSPIPAARASGAIVCEVTDAFTGLNMSFLSCACIVTVVQQNVSAASNSLFVIVF